MTRNLVTAKAGTTRDDGYTSSQVNVKIEEDHDTDIELTLPSGEIVILQYREESKTLDVCLHGKLHVVRNWAEGMKAAPRAVGQPIHVRKANQLCIELLRGSSNQKIT